MEAEPCRFKCMFVLVWFLTGAETETKIPGQGTYLGDDPRKPWKGDGDLRK